MLLNGCYYRDGHRLAYVQLPIDEVYAPRRALYDLAYLPRLLDYGVPGADNAAATTTMAEFWKDHSRLPGDEEGVILTEAGAFSAVVTHFLLNPRDEELDRDRFLNLWFQQYVNVGLLHIAVENLDISQG